MLNSRRAAGIALAVFLIAAPTSNAAPPNTESWVGSWASSPQLVEPQNRPPQPGLAGNTLRQVVHLTLGGSRIRLRLSNEFGGQPMTLDTVHVALPVASTAPMVKGVPGSGAEGVIPTTGAIRSDTDHAVTFGAHESVTIQPGAIVVSDPIELPVAPLSDLAISFLASKVPDGITGHPGSRATSFLMTGNSVSSPTLTDPVTADHWYVLDGVDVAGKSGGGSVVVLGDSITDGRGSVTNGNTRWADYLAKRLGADKHTANIGVLNEGIGGNCILRGGLGPTALSRFDRDVISQSGVKWLLIFEGVNDIGGSRRIAAGGQPTVADGIIFALQQFILRAHAHGIKVYGATITPFGGGSYSSPVTEAARTEVNDWIRTSGKFDAVADFDKAARDPEKPGQLTADADSGDHLHLSSAGYKRLAESIDLKLFAQ